MNETVTRFSFFNRISVFYKILIGYCALIALMLCLYGIIYLFVDRTLTDKEMQISETHIQTVSEFMDSKLNAIKSNMYGFLVSTDNIQYMQDLSHLNSSKITANLMSLKSRDELVETCYVFSKTNDAVLSNEGSLSKQTLYGRLGSQKIEQVVQAAKGFDYAVIERDDGENETADRLIVMVGSLPNVNPYNILLVVLNEQELKRMIARSPLNNYGNVCIVGQDGNTVVSTEGETNLENWEEISKSLSTNVVTMQVNKMLYTFRDSQALPVAYVAQIPLKSIRESMRWLNWLFLIIGFFITLGGIWISIVSARKYYADIVKLMRRLNLPIESKKRTTDEFTIISNALAKIDTMQFQHEVDTALQLMISTGVVTPVLERIFQKDQFIAALLMCIQDGKQNIVDLTSEFFFDYDDQLVYEIIREDEQRYYVIINGDNLEMTSVTDLFSKLHAYCETEGAPVMIGIGGVYNEMGNIPVSCNEAYLAIKQGVFSESQNDIYIYSDRYNADNNIYFPLDIETQILTALYEHDNAAVEDSIHQVFEKNAHLSNMQLQNVAAMFVNVYIRIANKCNLVFDIDEINGAIKRQYRRDILEGHVKALFGHIVLGESAKDDTAGKVYAFIVDCVEHHYGDPNLSLDHIADQLGLSVPYVSVLFKKTAGTLFSQYVLEYRIAKAAEFLKNTTMKVKDVSEKTGFGTYNNFARAFRKKMGLSPNEYRNTLQ